VCGEKELRSPVIEGERPSPVARKPTGGDFGVGLVGDCDDTVTSILNLGSVMGQDSGSDDDGDANGGDEGCATLLQWTPGNGKRSALREQTFRPSEISGRTGLLPSVLRSPTSCGGVGRLFVGVGGTLLVGVGATLLADEGIVTRSGALRVMFAPKDMSGRVGESMPDCDGAGRGRRWRGGDGVDVDPEGSGR